MNAGGHTLATIAAAIGGSLRCGDPSRRVAHLAIDSRRPLAREVTLFIALRGERHDGHRYVAPMLAQGAAAVLVHMDHAEEAAALAAANGAGVIAVPDTLEALQRLAAWHRGAFQLPVVGITGSNGKTIVKEWLAQLLADQGPIARSPGSWNSQVGVPLSVWELAPIHRLALFEAGISRPGEMERLRAIIKPTIGILTNIGPAHGENFPDDHAKALEKLRLFHDARTVIACADHPVVMRAMTASGLDQRAEVLTWSRNRSAFLHVTHTEREAGGLLIRVTCQGEGFTLHLPFDDPASLENALHCVTLLLHLGHAPEWIAERLRTLHPVAMRMQQVQGRQGITLINDAYSNDLVSLGVALDHLAAMAEGRARVVVLSDIHESGLPQQELYGRVATLLKRAGVTRLLAVGPAMRAQAHLFDHARCFTDADDLLRGTAPDALAHAVVLVKGARAFGLERVVEHWQEKTHGTVLEVDLSAVRHNLNHYRALLRPGTGIMPMVKAFGYGSGAVELARLFAFERVDRLGVAYADEGIALRQAGILLPILVMNPEPVSFELLHRFQLEPVVYDPRSLRAAIDHARTHSDAPPVHLKLDTGMHRLGFTADQLPTLLDLLRDGPFLRVATVFSHLAASEDPTHDAFTRDQLRRFTAMADAIDAVLHHRPLRHIANSAAISRFPEAHLDLVRPGIGLHGIGVNEAETARLRPAASLRTTIAQVTPVAPGESVGYSRRFVAASPATIAVLPIGYADGLFRSLGNGRGRVWIHGRQAPFAGNICMDMCMVDVTGIPCAPGDEVVLFDARHPVQEFAEAMGTIPYEALTAVSQRVKRVFTQE